MNNHWIEFTVSITVKINRGTFGIKCERYGEFKFCAQSRSDAVTLAAGNVKGPGERMVQVVGAIPIGQRHSDECDVGDHDFCNFAWCRCSHHSRVQFELEHPQLKSLSEIESEQREMEDAA
jgi:hypothetical protein